MSAYRGLESFFGQAVRGGRLREDLYHRLAVFEIELPPLRKRLEHMPLLVENFIQRFNREQKQPFRKWLETAWPSSGVTARTAMFASFAWRTSGQRHAQPQSGIPELLRALSELSIR